MVNEEMPSDSLNAFFDFLASQMPSVPTILKGHKNSNSLTSRRPRSRRKTFTHTCVQKFKHPHEDAPASSERTAQPSHSSDTKTLEHHNTIPPIQNLSCQALIRKNMDNEFTPGPAKSTHLVLPSESRHSQSLESKSRKRKRTKSATQEEYDVGMGGVSGISSKKRKTKNRTDSDAIAIKLRTPAKSKPIVPHVIKSHYFPEHPPSPALCLPPTPTHRSKDAPVTLSNSLTSASMSYLPNIVIDGTAPHGFAPSNNKYGLIQEELMETQDCNTIWRHCMATCLLNVTNGTKAIPVLWRILERWPTPELLWHSNEQELYNILEPLGLGLMRTQRLKLMSQQYVEHPPNPCLLYKKRLNPPLSMISHYVGVGQYALDSFNIFIADGGSQWPPPPGAPSKPLWKTIMPTDKELRAYLQWRWRKEGKIWDWERGVVAECDPA